MSFKKIFIFLVIISPFFWWQFFNNKNEIFYYYSSTPKLIKNKVVSIFTNNQFAEEFIWNDTSTSSPFVVGKKIYYSFQTILGEVFKYINNLNPRFYFQSGSGQADSPPNVEPIAILLLPCSILGIFKLFKIYKLKVLFYALISCFLGYITGQTSLYFLFPTAIGYLYSAAFEIYSLKFKYKTIYILILVIYSLFLFFRVNYFSNL